MLITRTKVADSDSLRTDPNHSEKIFQSRLLEITWKLIQLNPNESESIQTRVDLNRVWVDSDLFGLNIFDEFVRIHSGWSLGWVKLIFKRFSANEIENFFRIRSNWQGYRFRNESEYNRHKSLSRIVRIDAEWIPVRNFPQGIPVVREILTRKMHFSDLSLNFSFQRP